MYKTYNDVLTIMSHEFRGSETEATWKKRQDLCLQLNDMLNHQDIPKDFYDNLKPNIGPLLSAASSERTTLSGAACKLLCNLAKVLGTQLHANVDLLLPSLIDHCGTTKAVNQKNAHDTIAALIQSVGYNHRIVYHVCEAFKDKRIPVRTYAPIWLNLIIENYDYCLDADREFHMIQKSIATGLNDGQVKVRENTRTTYWRYARLDAVGAKEIMQSLNPHAATALENDPSNPNKPKKSSKESRPDSALAQIKAQKKKAAAVAASTASAAPVAPVKATNDSAASTHHAHGHIQTQAPELKSTASKESKALSSSTTSRPLLSAPIRRPRIVATPMTTTSSVQSSVTVPRPASRSETVIVKRNPESKERAPMPSTSTSNMPSSSGRQSPNLLPNPLYDASVSAPWTSTAKAVKRTVPPKYQRSPKAYHLSEPHIPFSGSAEYFTAPTFQPFIPSCLRNPVSGGSNSSKSTQPAVHSQQVSVATTEDGTEQISQRSGTTIHHDIPDQRSSTVFSADLNDQRSATTVSQDVLSQRNASALTSTLSEQRQPSVISQNVVDQRLHHPDLPHRTASEMSEDFDGKENQESLVFLPKRKLRLMGLPSYYATNELPANALQDGRRSITTAIERMQNGTMDVLGFRKLRKLLVTTYPGALINSPLQFDDLYTLIVSSIASTDELTESPEMHVINPNHAVYSRSNNILICQMLLRQYNRFSEPQFGQLLSALLIARSCHPDTHTTMFQAIDTGVNDFVAWTTDPLACIDAVLDTIKQLEMIIVSNNIVGDTTTRGDFSRHISTGAQSVMSDDSLYSDFGHQDNRFPNRLPAVVGFAVQILDRLLKRGFELGQTLFSVQEDRLAAFAEHCLINYNSLIKRRLMAYCVTLHQFILPEERFYSYFSREDDVNLINYYVAGAKGIELPYDF